MAITSNDIKIRKPERLTDFDDGGGRMIWEEVQDGVLNNVFNDVASGDRVYGRASLRPIYVHVATNNTDILAQAIGAIIARPLDPAVNVVMFATGSSTDVRSQARQKIESFRLMANEAPYTLYGDHQAGTQILAMYGRVGVADPTIGDVFFLSVEKSGYTPRTEPVKVQQVTYHETETFVDEQGEFQLDVLLIALTRPLVAGDGTFEGQAPNRITSVKPPTRIRATRPNDSAKFYGSQPLAQDIVASPSSKVFEVKVPSVFQPLVPATQSQTGLTDKLAGEGNISNVQSGPAAALSLTFNTAIAAGATVVRYLGMGFARGSLAILAGATNLVDDGKGGIKQAPGDPPTAYSGAVNYESGRIEISHSAGVGNTAFNVTATPAAPVAAQSFSGQIPITVNNQANVYIGQMIPTPSPGSVAVEYQALGEWIRLTDDGLGNLSGQPGQGTGTVNYATGSWSISTPAQPDIDSAVLSFWGTPKTTQRRDGDTDIEIPYVTYTVDAPAIVPSSLEITYLVTGSPVVLTDDGAGNIVNVADVVVGRVVYATGEIGFRPTTLPDAGSTIATEYDRSNKVEETFTPAVVGGVISFNLGTTPIRPGGMKFSWIATVKYSLGSNTVALGTKQVLINLHDNGAGVLQGYSTIDGAFTGTINYTTGAVSIDVDIVVPTWVADYESRRLASGRICLYVTGYHIEDAGYTFTPGTTVNVSYQADAAAEVAQSEETALPPVAIDLTPNVIDALVPGGVRFTFRGLTYVDRAGSLVHTVNPLNNAGVPAGSIDYASGVATLTSWTAGGTNALSVTSLLSSLREPGVSGIFFRAPGSPLQPGSFTIRASKLSDSTIITGTSDINGNISGDLMAGTINWENGTIEVTFGEWVTAAGNEAEPWYDADNIVAGEIWKPELVLPTSIFFGVVVYSYIHVSPVRLGLDPIMLPNDGRVVVFQPGVDLLIIDERETAAADPDADEVVNLARTNLSQIEVRDSAGTAVDSVWYTTNLDAGTVTFANTVPIGWAPYVLPLKIRHRVDARKGVSRVRITGEISLTSGLDRNFDAATTLVCSAINLGEAYGSPDVQARIGVFFDQATDEIGTFKDELVGTAATASYNNAAFPIALTNRGAMTQRWKIRFTGTTTFVVIGEDIGQLPDVYSTSSDCAPINPITVTVENPAGDPYFVIDKDGWGGGWVLGNILRFNTIGAEPKVWLVRVTQPSEPTDLPVDLVRFQVIGDA